MTALQLGVVNHKTNKEQALYETEYDKRVFKNFPKTAEHGKLLTVYVKGGKSICGCKRIYCLLELSSLLVSGKLGASNANILSNPDY